jgi:hypothetical protein
MKSSRVLFVAVFTALALSSCRHTVVREAAVYQAELDFLEQSALQPAQSLEAFIKSSCRCEAGKFTAPACVEAARRVVVVKARVPWHKAMALHNAGLAEAPAAEPPAVPAPETLCP